MRKKTVKTIFFFIFVSILFLGVNTATAFHGPGVGDEDFEYKNIFAIDWENNQGYGKLSLPVIYGGTDWIHEDESEHYWRHTSTYTSGGGDKIKFILYSAGDSLVWHGVYVWIYDYTYGGWTQIAYDTGTGKQSVDFYRLKEDLAEEQWSVDDVNHEGWHVFEVCYRVKAQCFWFNEQYDLYGRISFYY